MRNIFFIVLLMMLTNISIAQQNKKVVRVTRIKEKPEVDTLIKHYIRTIPPDKFKDFWNIAVIIITKYRNVLFSVNIVDSVRGKNIYTNNNFILKQRNFKYFKYKNRFVYVCGDDASFDLFEVMNKKENFTINFIENNDKSSLGGLLYVYEDGRFKFLVPTAH